MRNVILIVLIMFSTNLMSQKFDVPDGFMYTEVGDYIKQSKNKDKAIEVCIDVYNFYKLNTLDLYVDNESVVPVFTSFDSKKKNYVIVLFVIEYNRMYDVVLREIKDKDFYFFTYTDHDGYEYNLTYRKQ
mgnify:FL=1|tara:strand:+ start:1540 stop:1929 length:390 start_codon:yes stop_codon:yes gene_type:complete